jgi:hypothetical protein
MFMEEQDLYVEESESLIFIHISSHLMRESKVLSSLLPVGITCYAWRKLLIGSYRLKRKK